MYDETSKQAVLNLLDREPIRFVDGRYSNGFKDTGMLSEMIYIDHTAELFDNGGLRFVRRVTPPKDYRYA